jgi:hypothetical protein
MSAAGGQDDKVDWGSGWSKIGTGAGLILDIPLAVPAAARGLPFITGATGWAASATYSAFGGMEMFWGFFDYTHNQTPQGWFQGIVGGFMSANGNSLFGVLSLLQAANQCFN